MLSSQFGSKHTASVNADDEDEEDIRQETLKICCKTFVGFLFSTLGLCCLVFLYSVAGAFLFMALEEETQLMRMRKLQEESQNMHVLTVNKISSACLAIDCVKNATGLKEEITKLATMVQIHAHNLSESGWDGTFPGDEIQSQWVFVNSLLFCITTITLIGYGHIVPKTIYGQLTTIAYALFGIPLTLLYLANIGGFMADLVRYVYHHVCCNACCTRCCKQCCNTEARSFAPTSPITSSLNKSAPYVKVNKSTKSKGKTKGLSPASALTSKSESEVRAKYKRSVLDAPRSLRQLNVNRNNRNKLKGRKTKSSPESKEPSPLSNEKKNNAVMTPVTSSTSEYSDPRSEVAIYGVQALSSLERIADVQANTNNDSSLAEFRDQYLSWKNRYRHSSVPVSLTMLIMASYIMLGAMIFTFWEQWTFMQAFYFTFVTLTTIGLGDFVPGFKDNGAGKSVVCGVYVLVGLALIAMSLDLMQHEVKTVLVGLAKKIGLTKKKTNKESDTETIFTAIHS